MKHQLYNLKNLDEHTHNVLVTNEVDAILKDKVCTICHQPFVTREQKDNAILSDGNNFQFAHEECWPGE